MKNLQKGQVTTILTWAIGLLASAATAFTGMGASRDNSQDDTISKLNRETGELSTDIKYIKQAVDDLKAIQIEQLKAQGLVWKVASTTTR